VAAAERGRVLLIGIDGAAPRLVDRLLEAGRLPNLARIASRGVRGTIRSAIPIDSPRIWNTVVTGKVPDKHGINHFAREDAEGGKHLYLSSDRRVHALWNIVSAAGMQAGVVNFWNTYPPELINGVMVSDHLLAKNIEGRLRLTKAGEVPMGPVIHPAAWHDRLMAVLARAKPPTEISNPLRNDPDLPGFLVLVGDDFPRRFEEDGALVQIAREIDRELEPELLMVLLPGIDRTSHFLWLGLEDPMIYDEELRLSEAERRSAAKALERYYEYTDALIGVLMRGFDDDDLVIVMSDHGFEPGRGMGLLSGIHESEAAIDGVFFASGAGIQPGAPVGELSVADVTPTILSWLSIPVGEDMDGRPGGFIPASTIAMIPTHDSAPIARMELRPSGAEDEIVEQLRSLGYLE
jgi:predicted AlkP superfamily phosphohydrolase/phosphomutase